MPDHPPVRVTVIVTEEGHLRAIYASEPATACCAREHNNKRGEVDNHSGVSRLEVYDETALPPTVRALAAEFHATERRLFTMASVEVPKVSDPCRPEVRLTGHVAQRFLAWCARTATHPRARLTRMVTEFLANQGRRA